MKLHNDTNLAIDASHEFKEASFSIKASAAAFNILSSALYTDKISAVIRELSCNAYDAHVAAEKNGIPNQSKTPFDVTLPSSLSPVFKIRDYGTGLSETDIFELYTTYFGSTKSDSDDFIGALGLGSKSPFSIVSSFLVVSYFDQIKTVYTAIINAEGFPSIVKMHDEITDEPNGLEVNVTVTSSDIYSFQTRAQEIYKYFNVKPNFKGAVQPKIEELKYDYQGNGWAIRPYSGYNRNITAIQGLVAYNIPLEAVEGRISAASYELLETIDTQFVFQFNIGDVDIQASREALSFTNRTINAIEKTLNVAASEIKALIKKRITSAKTFIDAKTIYHNFDGYEKILASRMTLQWKNRIVNSNPITIVEERVCERYEIDDKLTGKLFRYKSNSKLPFNVVSGSGDIGSTYNTFEHDSSRDKEDSANPDFPFKKFYNLTYQVRQSHEGSVVFVLNDAKAAQFKLRKTIAKNADYSYVNKLWIFPHNKLKELERVKKACGVDSHVLTSTWDIEDEQREAVKKGCRLYSTKLITYSRYGANESVEATRRFHTIEDINDLEGNMHKYYVVTDGGAFSINHPFINDKRTIIKTEQLNDIMQTLVETKLFNASDRIVVVSKTLEPMLNELFPNLKPLAQIFDDNRKLTQEQTVAIAMALRYNKANKYDYNSSEVDSIKNFFKLIIENTSNQALKQYITNRIDTFSQVTSICDEMNALVYKKFLANNIHLIKNEYGTKVLMADIPVNKLEKITNEVKQYFPIFTMIQDNLYYDWNNPYNHSKFKSSATRAALTHYIEQDWKSVAILPEVINELTKGQNIVELV